jgi:hypothetical protein
VPTKTKKSKQGPLKRLRKVRTDKVEGRISVLFRIDRHQDDALTVAAIARAAKKGTARTDRSAIVRDALDEHLELKGKG